MLFDGAGLVAWDAGTQAPAAASQPDAPTDSHADAPAEAAAALQLVFISPEVANPQQIRLAFGASAEVIQLSAGRDGIDQISEALAGRHDVAAIHLISHGSADFISLPGQGLDSATLDARAAQIGAWAQALTADADILVYGCDVAGSERGVALIDRLAQITGADVGASTNDTGGTPGADWNLEYSSGTIATRTLYSAGLGDPAAYADRLATVNLSGSAGWTTIMLGTGKDPYNDSQAGAADTDIIGDATHGSLYTAYDDNGTATTGDDTLVFRMRIDNPTSTSNFGGVAIVGMDANLDGKVDLFFSVDGRNNGQAIRLLDPGTGANLSPSTTSTTALPTGWLPNNGVYAFSAGNYSVTAVSVATDPNWGPSAIGGSNNNLTGLNGVDAFVSWRVPIADIATVLAKPSVSDSKGIGPRGTSGIAGYGKDTVVQYISFTQTQTGPINGDLNGVGANYDKNATFASLGTFTSPMSASNPVPDGLSILISEPVGDGKLAGAPGATEASSVTLNGSTKASVGSTVNLTITDSAAGSTNATATVTAGANGINNWSVAGVNLSGLAEGTLTVSASVTNNSVTVTDTATVLLDKSAPAIAINQLATTTAGRPTLSGTSDLPDGAVVTLTLDTDNTPGTANLVYQAIVSGGAWTLNTATATQVSGTMPANGLTATTKVTASVADAAGNTATAVALNRPTVTSQTTGSTTPVIAGSWTNTAGDTLTVKLYSNNAGSLGSLLATYTLAPSGDTWSIDTASAIKAGGGTLGALTPDQTYHVVAEVTRGGSTVADTTASELLIVGGPAISITDSDGPADGNVNATVSKPVFSGTSTVINGYITLEIDPAGNGTADLIRYSVATNGSGNWSIDTANPSQAPTLGFMPAAGLSTTAVVTARTPVNANGVSVSAVQNVSVVIPRIMIGTSATDATGVETTISVGDATANIILADKIFNVREDDSVIVSGSTGNLAPGTAVTIVISDGVNSLTKTTTVAANGTFSLLASGAGTANDGNAFNLSSLRNTNLTVTATAAGVSAEKAVLHDAVAPQIVLTAPSVIKTSSAAATGNASLPQGSVINISTSYPQSNLTAVVDANGNFTTPLSMNGQGTGLVITASSTATDLAGNKVANATQTVNYQNPNTTPPAVSISTITGTGTGDTTITTSDIAGGVTVTGALSQTATATSGTLVVTLSDGFTTLTSGSTTGLVLTRGTASGSNFANTWTLTVTQALMQSLSNGTLVVKAQLTDTIGGNNGDTFVVRAVSQPTLLLLSGTPSVSIGTPIDPNNVFNAVENQSAVITGRAINATGGQVTVTVSDGDNSTIDPSATALVGEDGSWSTTGMNLSGLNDGTLTVSAVLDPDRNAATANNVSTSATVGHDKTPPQLNITSAASVGTSMPVIRGTSTGLGVGASVTVTINSDRIGPVEATYTTTVAADGSWSVTPAINTPIGSIIVASATDSAGNASSVTASAIATLSPDSGSNTTDFVTNVRTLTFTGYAGLGETVQLRLNGALIGSPVANASTGVWSFTHGVSLANGSYTLTALSSAGGNTALSTQTVVVDAQAVAIGAISSDSGSSGTDFRTNDSTLVFSGTASAGAPVTVSLADSTGAELYRQVAAAAGGNWSIDRTADTLADGVYTLRAAVTDASGVTTTVSQLVTVDTRAQIGVTTNYKVASTHPVLSGTTDIEAGRAITVSVAVGGGNTYTYSTTVAASGTWSVDTNVAIPAGQGATVSYANGAALTISASGTDLAGNSASTSKAMLIDLAAPVVNITTQLDYTGSNTPDGILVTSEDTNVILRGTTVNIANGGSIALTITDGTITMGATATVSNNAWTLSAQSLRALANGTISVTATYYDDGGTAFSAVATVLHDKTTSGTNVTIDSISNDTNVPADFQTNDNTLVFRGSAAAGATVAVTLVNAGNANVFAVNVVADSGGNWSYDYSGNTLADGSYTLKAQVGAGTLVSRAVVVDTTAPAGAVTVTNPVVTASGTPTLTGTAVVGAGETLSVSVNGKTYTNGDGRLSLSGSAWTLAIPAADALTPASATAGFNGVYEVTATITDLAGNTRVDASSNELTVQDLLAPAIDLDPSNGATINHSVTSASGAAVSLDDNADAMTLVESGNRLPRLTLTVGGLSSADGAGEKLVFGATVLAADGSNAGSLNLSDVTVGGVRVNIGYSAGVFTLQRFNFAPLSAAEAQAVLRDIQYRNDAGAASTAGTRTFTFSARDDAGNVAADAVTSVSVTVGGAGPTQTVAITAITDDVAPLTGTILSGGYSNDTTPGLSGTVSAPLGANEVVAVYRDGVKLGNAAVNGTAWTYADSGLADGAVYNYTAKVENTVNSSAGTASAAYVLRIDTSAPAQTVSIDSMTKDTGTAGDFITSDGTAGRTVAGTLSSALVAGETLELSFDGGTTWTAATVNGTGWTALDNGAHNGNWTITSRITDAAGNTGGAASRNVLLSGSPAQTVVITAVADDVAPVTGIVASGGVTNDTTPAISGTISSGLGANEVVAVYRDGVKVGNATVNGTAWSYADAGLADASTYNYTAKVENTVTAASGTTSAAYVISIDTSAPAQTVSIDSMTKDTGTAGDFITSDGTAGRTVAGTLSAGLGAGESLELSFDGGTTWTAATVNGTGWTALDNGAHNGNWTITSRITDAAGNTGGAASRNVLLNGAPAQTVAITAVADDVGPVTGIVASGGVTNDTTPAISGTISAGLGASEVVAVYRDGVKVGNATVNGTAWSYADAGLADASTYSYTAKVENTVTAASGTTSAAYVISIDTSAPAQTVSIDSMTKDTGSAGDFITSDGTAGRTVAGTLSSGLGAGETLELSFDGGNTWTAATVNGIGWTALDNGAHNGNWTITSRITDAAGNTGGAASRNVLLSGSPAQTVVITVVADDVAPVTGNVASGGVTNDTTPAISGTISAGLGASEVVAVYRDGVKVGNATINGTAWSYADAGLADASTYNYTAKVENTVTAASGTTSAAYVISIDTTAPAQTVSIDSMTKDTGTAGDFITSDGTAGRTVAGTLSSGLGAGETLELSFDGGTTWTAATVNGTGWTALDNGAHNGNWTITSRITDAAGNTGGAASRNVLLSGSPAQTVVITAVADDVAPVTGNVANGGVTNDVTPAISGTISAGLGANEVVAVYRDGVKVGNATINGTAWSYADAGLADASTYNYTAKVENTATAASGTTSTAYVISIDTTAPAQTVSIDSMTKDTGTAGDFITSDGTAGRTVAGTLSSALGAGESLELSFDGGTTWTAATVNGTGWTVLDNGAHNGNWTITSRITDAAGNTGGAASRNVVLNGAPVQTVAITTVTDDVALVTGIVASGGVTNDSTPAISGTVSSGLGANEVVAVYRNGVKVGNAAVNGTAWSFADAGLADATTYNYTAKVENTVTAASGTTSGAYTISIDTSAPAQTVSIVSMTKDTGTAGDFITTDGTAGRTVAGTLSAALGTGEVLEASFDGGLTWNAVTVTGTGWSTTDTGAHTGNWTIGTRITDAAGNVGGTASRSVVLEGSPLQTVSITAVTDDVAAVMGTVANGGSTNDNAPALSGAMSAALGANEQLVVYRDGVKIGVATVTGTTWTFADTGLADGRAYSYTAKVENNVTAAVGTTSAAYLINIDTSAPAQTVTVVSMTKDTGTADDFITADGSAGRTVTGTLSAPLAAGENLELSFDGGISWTGTTVAGSGWSALDNGAHSANWTISTRITDAAGNAGAVGSRAVTLNGAPAQTVTIAAVTDDVAPVTGIVANGGVTNDATPALSGTISAALGANEVVGVYRDGVKLGNASVIGTGTGTGTGWTYADGGLADGQTYTYTAKVENTLTTASGALSGAYAISIDTSAPTQTVAIVSMTKDTGTAGDFVTTDGSAGRTVTGTLSGPLGRGEKLELSFDGGVSWVTASVGGTGWSATDGASHAGNWTISSRIVDAAGNTGGTASRAVTLAAAALQVPSISAIVDDVAPLTGTIASGGVSNDTAPIVNGTLPAALGAGERVALFRNGIRIGVATVTGTNWSFADSGLSDNAAYSYTAKVESTVSGDSGTESTAYTLNIDTSAPAQVVSVTGMTRDTETAGDFVTSDGGAGRTVSGTISAPLAAGEVLQVSADGGVTWVAATVNGATWNATDGGSHSDSWTIATRIVDAAGNTGGATSRPVSLVSAPVVINPDTLPPSEPPAPAIVTEPLVPAAAPVVVAPAPALVLAPVASAPAEAVPAPASTFAPGVPLVSNGLPPPAIAITAPLPALYAQSSSSASVFEIDTGSSATGTTNAVQSLTGTDIGAGFSINVRQADGKVAAKDTFKLVAAVVKIDAGLVPERDVLAISVASPNITAVYDAATGTLTLTGIATAAEYEQVIQGVKLRDTEGGDVNSKRTLRFSIKSESGQTQNGTKEYRGPEAAPDKAPAPSGDAAGSVKAADAALPLKPGKPGLMAQIAKAHAQQTQGREQLAALAGRQAQRAAAPDLT